MAKLVVPRLNLNGSSKRCLMDGYLKVLEDLRQVQASLSKIYPHGRDYQTYLDSDERHKLAYEQHTARRQMLDQIYKEIEAIAEGVNEQQGR